MKCIWWGMAQNDWAPFFGIYWKINMALNSINKNLAHRIWKFRELAWHQNAAKGDSICWTQTPRNVKLIFEVEQMSIPQQRIRKAFRQAFNYTVTQFILSFFPSPQTDFLFFIELHFPFWKTERLLKFHCESAIPSHHWAKLVLWVWDAHTETDRVSLEIGWNEDMWGVALRPLGIVLSQMESLAKTRIESLCCCLPTKVTNSAQPIRGCGTVNAVEEPSKTDTTKVII